MNEPSLVPGCGVEPWMQWALDSMQMGVLILDEQGRTVYINPWVLQQIQPGATPWEGKTLAQIFPSLEGSYLESVVRRVTQTGFKAFLSQSLHPSPFPFYQSDSGHGPEKLIKQSVYVLAMGREDQARSGQRFVMIQINDMTQAVNRERLLKAQSAALHAMARTDALTGIGNRRHFDEVMALEFRQGLRSPTSLSLILVDIDHFKLYNDSMGHIKGDEALSLVAGAVRSSCHRPRDVAARYGGEEMALILPDTDLDGAKMVARKLKRHINDLGIQHLHSPTSQKLTVSIGLACLSLPGQDSPATLVEYADAALYKAKQAGRNAIFVHDGASISQVLT